MLGFKSRKRARAPEPPAKAAPLEDQAVTPTASPQKHPVAAFANTVFVDPVVKSVYRYVDKKTYLNWGLTSDWLVEGPRKRRASGAFDPSPVPVPASRDQPPDAAPSADEDPNASSEGYGEMTEGSIERLFNFLREVTACGSLAVPLPVATPPPKVARGSSPSPSKTSAAGPDPRWNLGPSSTFIDVGSGYGKVVLHAKLSVKVAKAVGIEYVPSRARMASDAKRELESGKHAFVTEEARRLLRDGCRLVQGDATKHGVFDFSHVYMYDKVFSDPTIELLAEQLNRSPYRILVSYQRAEVWRRLGLKHFAEAAALTMRTTGGQNFKAYVYINEAAR